MNSDSSSKIKHLLLNWPGGTVATSTWLAKQGVYQQLAYQYERSGWLRKIGCGAYARLSEAVEWTGAVYAMQEQLKLPVHVGGKTALALKGFTYFVSVSENETIYLFGKPDVNLPSWFTDFKWKQKYEYKTTTLFGEKDKLGITTHSLGSYSIHISSPERAIMEALYLVSGENDLEEVMNILETLRTLRSKLVQDLLETCRSIKVKRLFLALAERTSQTWFKDINIKKINLGKGKRQMIPGGVWNKKYQITLPKSERGDDNNG